ncbi:MAG: hypothetical protein R2780_05620 [Crocinitomicaceae bacterium]
MKDVVELPKASVEKLDPDVIITHYKSGAEIHEEDAVEIDGAHLSMSHGGEMFLMVDMTAKGSKVDRSAEFYFNYKGKMVPYIKALAVVRDGKSNLFSKLFNLNKSNRALFPMKEFTDAESAKRWFDSLRN